SGAYRGSDCQALTATHPYPCRSLGCDLGPKARRRLKIALLTGGRDKPYALGLAAALVSHGLYLDFIGSNEVDSPELHGNPQINFLKLRDQRADAGWSRKMFRVLSYYLRLTSYAANAQPKIFHILWG